MKDARQVGLQNSVPVVVLESEQQAVDGKAGVVDEDINSSLMVNDVGESGAHGVAVADVEAESARLSARCADQPDGLRGSGLVGHVVHDYRRALGCQPARDRAPDAARRAGDDGVLSLEGPPAHASASRARSTAATAPTA